MLPRFSRRYGRPCSVLVQFVTTSLIRFSDSFYVVHKYENQISSTFQCGMDRKKHGWSHIVKERLTNPSQMVRPNYVSPFHFFALHPWTTFVLGPNALLIFEPIWFQEWLVKFLSIFLISLPKRTHLYCRFMDCVGNVIDKSLRRRSFGQ